MKKMISKLIFVMNPQHTRGMMNYVKENYDRELTGAEIGVAEGFHVFKYLKTNHRIKQVFLVDPYKSYVMDGEEKDYSWAKRHAKKRLREFDYKIDWIEKTSEEASNDIPNGTLDFVYIDANHSYDSTKKDIKLWYPKVKKGGVIGGHDFSGSFPGVAKAVIEFAEEKKIDILGKGADWWYRK